MDSIELKCARLRARKNQIEMAKAIGKSRESYVKKENGEVKFSDDERLIVKNELGLTWEQFNAIFFDNELPIGNNDERELPTVT